MMIGMIKTICCLLFFLLVWTVPALSVRVLAAFNDVDERLQRRERLVLILVFSVFVFLTLFFQPFRQTGGDEAQAWLIARDASTFREMISYMGYEGTPALWHTILRPFATHGVSISVIYIFNYAFIFLAVVIWLLYAPFPLLVRIIFPFTYVILTEYSIIARSYALSTMLLFISMVGYSRFRQKWIWWSLAFSLLANSNLISTILCCGFVLYLAFDWIKTRDADDLKAICLIGFGILLAAAQVWPPADLELGLSRFVYQGWLTKVTNSIVTGYPPLSPLLYSALLFQVLWVLKNREGRIALVATQLLLLFLFEFKYIGEFRHHYYLFLSMLMFLWLGIKQAYKQIANVMLAATFIMMASSSIPLSLKIFKEDPKVGKVMATFLQDSLRMDSSTFIATYPDYIPLLALPFLPDKKFYQLEGQRRGSFLVWNHDRDLKAFTPDAVRNIASLATEHEGYKRYYYFYFNRLPEDSLEKYNIKLVKFFPDANLARMGYGHVGYYLYQLPTTAK